MNIGHNKLRMHLLYIFKNPMQYNDLAVISVKRGQGNLG